jgi:hypothetical protein
MIGKLVDDVIGGGKENFLRAIPLGVTMDSHLHWTIAQFLLVSNPKIRRRRGLAGRENSHLPFGNGADFV